MNPDYKEIGKNIRLMRIRHGISQSELAQRLDVSQTHMSNLEHGRVSVSLRVLLRLAHFFKCQCRYAAWQCFTGTCCTGSK